MKTTTTTGTEIAVVGLALRVPGAVTADEFFDRLCRGEELIRRLDDATLRANGVAEAELANSDYVKAAGYLDDRFRFDAGFFDYKPREAEFMDPQLRLLHECCWEALESAGCDPKLVTGAIGLYAGSSQNMNWLRAVAAHVGDRASEIYDLKMVYQREFFPTRVSYRLNLKGPAIGIDTTCSTSLVALHMAAQGLLSGDCDVALAGGVCVSPLLKGYQYHDGMIQSPDGHCRAFDARAGGTVPGQGIGIVALKRLEDAVAERNPILAVLRASAVNNDGNDKVGYTAPSVSGQSRAIRAALELAEIDADGIDFVECHGTATRVGDPIEVEALAQAYGRTGARCLIGSVKSNIGHPDVAAGILGFIKAVLAVKHGVLPPSLHYERPNPIMGLEGSRFAVNNKLTPLSQSTRPLRAGVSSFGVGGTNAHVIVEEYLAAGDSAPDSGRHRLLPLSARDPDALRRYASKLRAAVAAGSERIDALSATLQQARRHFPLRAPLVAATREQFMAQLDELAAGAAIVPAQGRRVVFMFSGQGAQYPGMTRDLYTREPRYRGHVDACLALLEPDLAARVRALMLAELTPEREAQAADTALAQPLLFVVEYALARTLIDWGIVPAEMVGHSLGEYVAACLAGVFTPADALALVAERGRLMASARPGLMLSVRLSEDAVRRYLDDGIALAAVNSTSMVVLAGAPECIAALEARLAAEGVACTRLKTSHAYHSHMMDDVIERFRARVRATPRADPLRSYRSNLSGGAITAAQAQDPEYWCRHLRATVRFAAAAGALLEEGHYSFLEIGPGNALATFVRSHAAFGENDLCLQTVRHPRQPDADDAFMLRTLGRLYADGAQPDWAALSSDVGAPFVSLPAYALAPTVYDQIAGAGAAPVASRHAPQAAPAAAICHPRPALSVPFEAARSDVESRLSATWARIFKLDRVGIDDNFFELGGHSLLATRVLAEVRDEFGVEISVAELFQAPTVRDLAAVAAETGRRPARVPALVTADRSLPIPMSFQQRRLWMIDRLGGGSAQYNMPSPFILHGRLDERALQGALDLMAQRHESLRTVFHEVDGEAVQVVLSAAPVALTRLDLSGLPEPERRARQRALVREDAMRTFDLAREWPMRVTLATLGEREHLLMFNIHHIVSDGWSEIILVKEFSTLYRALAKGEQPVSAPLAAQYADFASWQRGWLTGDALEQELGFWRDRLAGIPPVHNLPLDKPRPSQPDYAGALIRRRVPHALLERLREFSQANRATLFMTLQTIFAVLLGRWSNSEDIVMGTPIAGRQHKAVEPLIGFFVNTLLLRTDLAGNPDFLLLLARTREMALSAFEHQHVPFEMLVDQLVPVRSTSHTPLFQVLFALQNYERGALSVDGLELERVEQDVSAKFDLTLITAESPDGLLIDWYYATSLFEAGTIERMSEQFELLLESVLAQPAQPVLTLPLLPAHEQSTLLEAWQRYAAPPAEGVRVENLFEDCAARHPEAQAIMVDGVALTYRELNQRANRLAHLLAARGVRAADLVAICLPSGPDMIAAMFAVLKCGGAYVPLDPGYPAQRLAHMLAASRPAALITGGSLDLQPDPGCLLVDMGSVATAAALAAHSPADPPRAARAEGLDGRAYVIFTSGSTGTPKGVVITQRQLLASLAARFAVYKEPVSCALLLSSTAFDASVTTIFGTLLTGGRMCLCDEHQRRDAGLIAELIDRLEVSHLLCLPSVYNAVLEAIDGVRLTGSSLQVVILAAETFTTAVKARHFSHPTIRAGLFNEYGPTECSVWSTVYQCSPQREETAVPIGHSPGHARLYVLNEAAELAPIGVEGELYIGGDGVGAGYLGQPELTAARFVPDRFWSRPDARMYRSGDRVRWRADGELEILGRMDHQVKLRGYRIELAEIEGLLEQHPSVERAVARVVDERMVAYVSPAGAGAALDFGAARAFLTDKLPDYMLPQALVVLDSMPLMPNGKVDVARLPAAPLEATHGEPVTPRNAVERRVLEVWCDVLKQNVQSVDANFFALGADSILLLKVSAMLSREGLRFPVKEFYADPTVETMARLIETVPGAVGYEPAQGAQLLHPMQSWFLGGDPTDLHHFNQAVLLDLGKGFDFTLAEPVVAALYARHDVLRLAFHHDAQQGWTAGYRDAHEVAAADSVCRIEIEAGADPAAAIEQAASRIQASLSLTGPLLKVACLALPDGSARLLIVAHHLIVDGVSWRALLQDFEQGYRQCLAGQAPVLPPRPASYQSAVAHLHALAASAPVQAERDYWRTILAQPLDAWHVAPGAEDMVADEASETVALPTALTAQLLGASRHAYGMHTEEVLLAALRVALLEWRGVRTLGVMLESHGRAALGETLDIGDTVGWFTAAYPVVFADADAQLAPLLRDTKERLRRIPAKGAHYGALKYLTDSAAELDDSAFRRHAVVFNYLGQFDQTVNAASMFAVAGEPYGRNVSGRRRRDAALSFDGMVSGGVLRFSIRYNRHHFAAADIAALAGAFERAIAGLVDCWRTENLRALTPSDVPLLALDQDELAQWQGQWPALRDAFPATAVQQGMLVQSLRGSAQHTGAYINQLSFDLEGEIEVARLLRAWAALPERHDVFRAAFAPLRQGGIAHLLMAPEQVSLPVAFHDLEGCPAPEQQAALAALAAVDRRQGFDLARAPLSRVTIWRLAPDRHRVLWTTHHALIDGWSIGVALRTLIDAYAQDGARPAPAAGGFKQFVEWQAAQDRAAAAAYWQTALKTRDEPCLLAPTGRDAGVSTAASHQIELAATQSARLEQLARGAGVTQYALIQCAWAYLLHLHTGLDRVCFGSVDSGRPPSLANAESIVGLFINTLPVILEVDHGAALGDWIRTAHRRQMEGRGFAFLPLPQILAQARNGARTGLFNTVLVYENYPLDSIRTVKHDPQALRLTDLHSVESTGSGLTLVAMPSNGLTFKLMYHSGEFSEDYAASLLDQFVRLLTAMPELAGTKVAALDDVFDTAAGLAAGDLQTNTDDDELLALLAQLDTTKMTNTEST